MKTFEEICKELNFSTKSKNIKKAFYDKFIRFNKLDLINYPELIIIYPSIKDKVDWVYISTYQKLSEDFIREFKDKVDWFYISRYQKLSEDFICEFKDKVNWNYISKYQKLSESEFKDGVNWFYISKHQKLSESFIREFKDGVNWFYISKHQKLSESFIREFKDEVNWNFISTYQKLSESFIREFKDKVNWNYISKYQKLSEDFIREFKDKVNWNYISKYQKLSEDFIREFKDKVDWFYISKYQKLSEDFIREFVEKYLDNNWMYVDESYKKKKIVECGLYECYNDYFIAYKGIRSDRYSKYNFQYQYNVNETYECHADYTDNENSFGLSVWNELNANEYCNELVVKCKVYYKDVARMVHGNGKIRCTKITILN